MAAIGIPLKRQSAVGRNSQRLIAIGAEIVDVFAADGKADAFVGEAGVGALQGG